MQHILKHICPTKLLLSHEDHFLVNSTPDKKWQPSALAPNSNWQLQKNLTSSRIFNSLLYLCLSPEYPVRFLFLLTPLLVLDSLCIKVTRVDLDSFSLSLFEWRSLKAFPLFHSVSFHFPISLSSVVKFWTPFLHFIVHLSLPLSVYLSFRVQTVNH